MMKDIIQTLHEKMVNLKRNATIATKNFLMGCNIPKVVKETETTDQSCIGLYLYDRPLNQKKAQNRALRSTQQTLHSSHENVRTVELRKLFCTVSFRFVLFCFVLF